MKKMISVDFEKCLGCKSCELACAIAHSHSKDLWLAVAETPLPQSRLDVEPVDEYAMPLHCRHCEDAPCIKVCPTHAMTRSGPDEPVVCRFTRCIGCTMCMLVCPFGVLKMDRAGKVIVKCDLCLERRQEGLEPACVTACPTRAIQLVSAEKFSDEVAQRARADLVAGYQAGERIKIPVKKQ